MSVSLTKGGRVSLKKEAPNLKRILVGLGWDPVKQTSLFGFGRAQDIDIDASIICMDANDNCKSGDVVYYGNKNHSSGAINHSGDNLTGEGDGDDEQIQITLDKIPSYMARLIIIINIYQAYSRNQDFGKVRNCFVHIDDLDTGKELVRYNVDGNFDGKTGIYVAELYLNNGEWKFKAVGEGVKAEDIREMVRMAQR